MLKRKFMAALAVTAALSTAVSGMGVSTFADESEPAAVGSLSDGIGSIKPIDDVPGPSITPSPDRRSTGQINKQDTTNADTKTNHTGNSTDSDQKTADAVPMYRLYNPNSGEHFYTASVSEKNYLAKIGWHYEGIGWYAPTSKNGIPVYRLYNKNGGEHHYTVSIYERRNLIRLGWKDEGIGWYSYETYDQGSDASKPTHAKRIPKAGYVSLYRQYNPNAYANNHNYTSSISENNYLVSLGWRAEGIGWYGVKVQKSESTVRSGNIITLYQQARNGLSGSFTLYGHPGTIRNGVWFSSESTADNAWGMLKEMEQNISETLGTDSGTLDDGEIETRVWDYNGEEDAIMLSCHELPLYVDVQND